MADTAQDLQQARLQRALDVVRADLGTDSSFQSIPVNEAPELLAACPAVWRRIFRNSDKDWVVNVGLSPHFPDEVPIACIANAADLLFKNPHIDERGFICTIPTSALTNANDPAALVRYVFDDAERILRGTGTADFQNEFTSYWLRSATLKSQPIFLVDPIEVIGQKFSSVFHKEFICIGASPESISRWITNRTGARFTIESPGVAIAVRRSAPLIPSTYPETVSDLIAIAQSSDPPAAKLIQEHMAFGSFDGLALLVQNEGDGVALGAVVFPTSGPAGRNSSDVIRGFRPGKVPAEILRKRLVGMMNPQKILRGVLHRVDHRWIHSRGGDGRDLSNKSVLLIGGGSLGGYVAHLLARAGLGRLTITDNDCLSWENVGRHLLGATFVGRPKSEALAEQLSRELPHLIINGIRSDWRDALAKNPNLFTEHDLIISTTGDWRCERPLNEMTRRTEMPPLILAWLEPHAVAGHCLVVARNGGCFECRANEFGRFLDTVATFEKPPLSREPGGCAHYQQYGPTALMPVASMVASTATDCLLNNPPVSYLKSWISSKEHFDAVGATLTESWKQKMREGGDSRIFVANWEKSANCGICAQATS